MPEGHEVEKIRQRLLTIVNQAIIDIQFASNARIQQSLQNHVTKIIDARLQDVVRHGKYLAFQLEQGWLLNHLRMTGGWKVLTSAMHGENGLPRFWRAQFILENDMILVFTDVRQLGILEYHQINPFEHDKRLLNLGPDASDPRLIEKVQQLLAKKKRWQSRKLGDLLLDQRFVAGIGNIYRSEILHEARLHPTRTIASLSDEEKECFLHVIQKVMARAFQVQAQDLYPFEVGKGPQRLENDYFIIYGREGQTCYLCREELIEKLTWKGRSIYYCPRCQQPSR